MASEWEIGIFKEKNSAARNAGTGTTISRSQEVMIKLSPVSYWESLRNKTLFIFTPGKDQDLKGEPKMEFEEIEPQIWKPEEEGDSVEGVLITRREKVGPNDSRTYHLEKNGDQIMIWGSTVLDQRMDVVKPGEYIRVTFKGTQKNVRGQETKIFKVEREKKSALEKSALGI